MVTYQLQVRCRPVKVRRSETDVLPLSHPTNCRYWRLRLSADIEGKGVCWWLKKGWVPVDVFCTNYPHRMYFSSTPLPSPPSLLRLLSGMVLRISLLSLAARSWINTMNIAKYKKLGLMSIVQCKCQRKIVKQDVWKGKVNGETT